MGKCILDKEVFKKKMTELMLAFNSDIPAETLAVYWAHTSEKFSNESFIQSIDSLIATDNFFPRVSRILQAAKAVTKEEILKKYGLL